jgi:hypothetical protein
MAGPWEQYQQEAGPWQQYQPTDQPPGEAVDIPGVFESPELNEMSMRALKAGFGGLLTGDPESLGGIIKQQYPDAEISPEGTVTLPSGTYNLASSAPARFAFDVGSFMAGGPVTGPLKRRIGLEATKAMGIEAGQEVAEEQLGGEEASVKDVALAGVTEIAGQGVGEIMSGLLRGTFGKMAEQSEELLQAGKQADVPIMTSDVLPPRTFMGKSWQTFMERLPVIGTAGKRDFQQAAREGAIEKLAADFGVTPDMPFSETVIKSLDKMKTKQLGEAARLKNSSRDALSVLGEVPRDSFMKAIDDAIEAELQFGTKADKALIESLEQWKQAPAGDFKFMDQLRSRLGDEISDYYTGKNSQMGSKGVQYLQQLKNALTKDMDSVVSGAKDPAMKAAARDWKRANAMFFQEYGKYKDSALKGLLDKGEIQPEVVMNILRGNKPSQSKLLFDNLTPAGRNAAKGAIAQDLVLKADGSPQKLISAMKRLDPNIKVFFKGDDLKVLQGFSDVLKATQRAGQASVRTPTGESLYPAAMGALGAGGMVLSPGITTAVLSTAGAGRIYESPAIRDGLLKLANTPAGSVKYDKVLREVTNSITAMLQAERDEE